MAKKSTGPNLMQIVFDAIPPGARVPLSAVYAALSVYDRKTIRSAVRRCCRRGVLVREIDWGTEKHIGSQYVFLSRPMLAKRPHDKRGGLREKKPAA